MRLLGNIEAKIDAKGRVFLPVAFRKVLQEEGFDDLVLRKDVYQPCLTLYPKSAWNEQLDILRARLNRWNPHHQQLYRQFLWDVEIVNPDSSGRILISKHMLEYANIVQSIRFIGLGDCIEIWSCENTTQPFVGQKEFTDALERLMNNLPLETGGQP